MLLHFLLLFLLLLPLSTSFLLPSSSSSWRLPSSSKAGKKLPDPDPPSSNPIKNFFQALDDFIDDATMRKLGGGAKFYGKRKSGFYGSSDSMKKSSRAPDSSEDYVGPTNSGYFVWKKDESTGEMKPMTRMKGKVIEKPKRFWGNDDE
ncbi:hypothetical protein TrST_g14016 [Triparma strigata]|uniref:Uncharacterized protein n=1 Tax=Triparma strigata TaxID=1606541 RepID=A0A9W7ECW3_9STRA|nr:hypothetical protein TrST_g14016 [Triparma strigata]